MCRMVAYLGKMERPLSSLVLDPQHSLLVQSYAPKEMMSGVINADGFGVGWYAPEVDGEPAVYRSNAPIWADRSFASIASRVRSSTVLAAVRSATPGLPAEESGVPPFASGPYLFAHLLDRLRAAKAHPGDTATLAEATSETLRQVSETCSKLDVYAALNVGATDGEAFVFARYSTQGPGNSLYFAENSEAFPDAVVVASERLDGDGGWQRVPDRHLLVASIEAVTTHPQWRQPSKPHV